MKRWLGALTAIAFLLAASGFWLARQFAEPDARRIESLAAELQSRVLVAVFAHPDDEIMVAGALADASRRGVRVHVITATRGEKGTPDVPVSGPDELARVRESELREHGRVLGFAEQIVWTYPDREVDQHLAEVTAAIARELDRIRPDTVLTFHPESGMTSHPDHLAVGAAATRAQARAAPEARLVYVVAPRRVMARFGGARGATVARNQPPATYAMPIDPAVKLRGWKIHASQGDYTSRAFGVPPAILYRFFDEEHYLLP